MTLTVFTSKPSKHCNERGFTLAELLIAMIISVIAVLMIAIPFVAERNFWRTGQDRVEARRDAQMVLRAMARIGRSSLEYEVGGTSILIFRGCSEGQVFQLTGANNDQLVLMNNCATPAETQILIDGGRSRVNQFAVTPLSDRVVRIELEIIRGNEVSGLLQTELFVRNAAY